MLVTLAGIVTVVSSAQPESALAPIAVTGRPLTSSGIMSEAPGSWLCSVTVSASPLVLIVHTSPSSVVTEPEGTQVSDPP